MTRTHDALALSERLRASDDVEVRPLRVTLSHSTYRADDKVLIVQHAFGIPPRRAPVLRLHRTGRGYVPRKLRPHVAGRSADC